MDIVEHKNFVAGLVMTIGGLVGAILGLLKLRGVENPDEIMVCGIIVFAGIVIFAVGGKKLEKVLQLEGPEEDDMSE